MLFCVLCVPLHVFESVKRAGFIVIAVHKNDTYLCVLLLRDLVASTVVISRGTLVPTCDAKTVAPACQAASHNATAQLALEARAARTS